MHLFSSSKLIVFRGILKDPTIKKVVQLVSSIDMDDKRKDLYYQIFADLLEGISKETSSGHLWQNYLLGLLIKDENILTLEGEKLGSSLKGQLYQMAVAEIENILSLYNLNWEELRLSLGIEDIYQIGEFSNYSKESQLPEPNLMSLEKLKSIFKGGKTKEITDALLDYYQQWGCGVFSKFRFFRWAKDDGLVGIANYDSIKLEDLVGYKYQQEMVKRNTEAFIEDRPCNNLLLFGDKGTGKSSTVKAIGNEYFARGLRIVELSKDNLMEFPKLMGKIGGHALKFIIFLDDLSFEEFEVEYKHIKAMIEGGLEIKPKNILIYATSNRRHLIKETWADQQNSEGIRISDSVQEKLSLADRFGITITFGSPDQEEYLEIVSQLALKNGINLPQEDLYHRALQWELWYHGRSGRTAQQFINYLLGEKETTL